MKNQERFLLKLKDYLREKGLDLEEFDSWYNDSDFSNSFNFFSLSEIEIALNIYHDNGIVRENLILKVGKLDHQLIVDAGQLGHFNYVPEWTIGDRNYYFFNIDSAGVCHRLRIFLEDNNEPCAGDLRRCMHYISKNGLGDFSEEERDSLIWDVVATFNVRSFKVSDI